MNQSVGLQLSKDDMSLPDTDLRKLLYLNRVLEFTDINFSTEEYWNFCSKFGTPWDKDQYIAAKEKDIIEISPDKYTTLYHQNSYNRLTGMIPPHSDVSNEPHSQPLPTRALYCISLPEQFEGGATFFIDLAKAYKLYPNEIIEKYKDYEIQYQSWQNVGTYKNWYKLVQYHPYTNEPFFMINYCDPSVKYPWVTGFRDKYKVQQPINEVQMLIDLSQSLSYYEHHWKVGDLIVMDNLASLHGKTSLKISEDSVTNRAMWRCTIEHNLPHNIIPVEKIN